VVLQHACPEVNSERQSSKFAHWRSSESQTLRTLSSKTVSRHRHLLIVFLLFVQARDGMGGDIVLIVLTDPSLKHGCDDAICRLTAHQMWAATSSSSKTSNQRIKHAKQLKTCSSITASLTWPSMAQRPVYLQRSRERCRIIGFHLPICGIGAGVPGDENGRGEVMSA
jgi:hypothetical protein